MSYTSPKWKNGSAPALSAETLQLLTDAVEEHDQAILEKANKATANSALLAQSEWNAETKSITVQVTGITSSNNLVVAPAAADFDAYCAAAIRCTGQAANTLTFGCATVPAEDILVQLLIVG